MGSSTLVRPPGPTAEVRGQLRSEFRAGVVAITPMVVGVLPFALAIGSAAAAGDIPTPAAIASAPMLFAGAAQLTTTQMLDAGTAPVVIIVSALMINARILLYSASLAPWFRGESLLRRLVLAIPVIDQLHFTCVPRFERGDLDRHQRVAFYAGAAAFLATAWVVAHTIAVLAGSTLPDSVGLHVAAPAALAGLMAKSIPDRSAWVAAAVAGFAVVAAAGAPFRSAVLIAAIVGIAAGSTAQRREVTS